MKLDLAMLGGPLYGEERIGLLGDESLRTVEKKSVRAFLGCLLGVRAGLEDTKEPLADGLRLHSIYCSSPVSFSSALRRIDHRLVAPRSISRSSSPVNSMLESLSWKTSLGCLRALALLSSMVPSSAPCWDEISDGVGEGASSLCLMW